MKHKHVYRQNVSIIGKDHGTIELVCGSTKDGYCGKHLTIYWGDDRGDIKISNLYETYKRIIGND